MKPTIAIVLLAAFAVTVADAQRPPLNASSVSVELRVIVPSSPAGQQSSPAANVLPVAAGPTLPRNPITAIRHAVRFVKSLRFVG
jgi:hypothetical protein